MVARSNPTPRGTVPWGFVLPSVVIASVAMLGGCHPPRERAASETDLGYPTCPEEVAPALVASGTLRDGPNMRGSRVVERFAIERRGCVTVFTARQEWPLSVTDLDVAYDSETQLPLRVWKRTVSPGPQPIERRTDTRRFELRSDRVALTRHTTAGALEHWWLRGARPTAVIGPGRGLLTMWLRRVRLPVGGRARETVLDVRESMEVIREATLARLEDRDDPALGRTVRVYTIYGREAFFADEDDVVIGDLMGLLPADRVSSPLPPPSDVPPADPR